MALLAHHGEARDKSSQVQHASLHRCVRDGPTDDGRTDQRMKQKQGVFLVMTRIAFVPVKRDLSVNTDS